jgi:uncharacterized protein (TIGR02266 family)
MDAAMNLELDSVEKQQADLEAQLAGLAEAQRVHDQQGAQIEAQASELEGQIRELASQEAALQLRKRELQDQAKAIGQQRSEAIRRQKEIDQSRQALQNQLAQVAQNREQAVADLAEEERLRQQLAAQDAAWRAAQEAAQMAAQQAAQQETTRRSDPADKRSTARIAVAVDVSYQTEHNFFMGLTENLSEGGLFIATYDSLPLGTELDLTLNLPENEPILAHCEVRWVREHTPFTQDVAPGLGVQFLNLTESHKVAIRSFLAQRDPILYEAV